MRIAALEPYRDRARAAWGQRSPREQRLLAILGVILGVALLLILIVRPLQDARSKALADIRTYETLSARLRAAGGNIGQTGVTRTGPIAGIVTTSAAQFGIAVQRLEPEGNGVRVAIAEAPFDQTLRWLADLERTSAVRIVQVKLDRRPTPATVEAELLLETR